MWAPMLQLPATIFIMLAAAHPQPWSHLVPGARREIRKSTKWTFEITKNMSEYKEHERFVTNLTSIALKNDFSQ